MNKWTILLLSFCTFLAGCAAPSQQGLNFMNAGNFQAAYNVFSQCAANGDPYCINNIGVMYHRGQMQGGVNVTEAVKYYTLAARYGIPIAQQNLRALGRPVPPADLQAGYQYQQAQEQQAAAELGRSVGCALGGGCAQNAYQPTRQTAPQSRARASQIVPAGCNSNFECGYGEQCVKPAGTFGKGKCVTPVDDFGNKTYEMAPLSIGPREIASCSGFADCPIGFRCVKEAGDLYGLCIK